MDLKGWIQLSQKRMTGKLELQTQESPTVLATQYKSGDNQILLVFTQTNGTSTQPQSTGDTMEPLTSQTLEMFPTSQTTIYSALDSLVKRLVSLENVGGSMTHEVLYSLKSLGFSETKDPDILSWRTLRVCLVMTLEKLSQQYLGFSPTWGIELNGWYLTASTLEFPKTGNGCSLSDILETDVADKYFLSEKQVKGLLKGIQKPQLLERSQQEVTQEDITQV